MSLPFTPVLLTTLNNQSILGQSNTNFTNVQTALTDGLSRSGNTPNQMNSSLDMNSNQILNLPPPSTINSPLRVQDVADNATQIASIHAANNTWTGTNTFSNTVTTNSTLTVNGTVTGNKTGTGNIVLDTSPTMSSPTITGTVGGSASYTTPTLTSPTVTGAFTATGLVTNADLATVSNQTLKSNISGGTASPSDNTLTALLDNIFTNTQGSVLYRGASNWTSLPPGTAGQLLQTGGAAANPSWASASITLLNTLTANNVASLSDTTSFTSSFSTYMIIYTNMLSASATQALRFKVNSGGVQSTNYLGGVTFQNLANLVTWNADAQTTFVPLDDSVSATAGMGASGIIYIYNPSQTASTKPIIGEYLSHDQDGVNRAGKIFSFWNGGTGAITGFQIDYSSGNITSGTVKVYGIP